MAITINSCLDIDYRKKNCDVWLYLFQVVARAGARPICFNLFHQLENIVWQCAGKLTVQDLYDS